MGFMTTTADPQVAGSTFCWCCGNSHSEVGLIRLGSHPEIAVCLDCARFLNRRAGERRDEVDRPWTRRFEVRSVLHAPRSSPAAGKTIPCSDGGFGGSTDFFPRLTTNGSERTHGNA